LTALSVIANRHTIAEIYVWITLNLGRMVSVDGIEINGKNGKYGAFYTIKVG
jgi:hypothetical protein